MTDISPQFEVQDLRGSTKHYTGAATTTPVLVPSILDKIISSVYIENTITNSPVTKELLFSFDAGLTYQSLRIGESFVWSPKGEIKQFYIKSSTSTVNYQVTINFEDY